MPPVEQLEFKTFRSRVYSLENRLQSFERTAMDMLRDICHALNIVPVTRSPLPMLRTPAELVFRLRSCHPELAAHPALWHDLEQLLIDERQALNQQMQQEIESTAIALGQRLEALLHPLEPGDADPQDPAE